MSSLAPARRRIPGQSASYLSREGRHVLGFVHATVAMLCVPRRDTKSGHGNCRFPISGRWQRRQLSRGHEPRATVAGVPTGSAPTRKRALRRESVIFTETRLKGAFVIDLERREDRRGFFARAFCQNEFEAHG